MRVFTKGSVAAKDEGTVGAVLAEGARVGATVANRAGGKKGSRTGACLPTVSRVQK